MSISCVESNPNQRTEAIVEAQTLQYTNNKEIDSTYRKRKIYVPIYSDIYRGTRAEKTLLTATLSIRNTSERDSLFINRVDYFNTQGQLVRQYLNGEIYLDPLETLDYIIEERDTLGGSGANFIIECYGKKHVSPVFQAIMIGGLGNRVFAFTANGIEIEEPSPALED
ncbi:hypothetical protein GCM10009117_25000 [Gangjinia marincola]|uniref:DUF3124 domain-containing protein n=1 Tax=Gangjinia marincola TaxID=578463 RepID=A0ABN1MJF8_9FLAO